LQDVDSLKLQNGWLASKVGITFSQECFVRVD